MTERPTYVLSGCKDQYHLYSLSHLSKATASLSSLKCVQTNTGDNEGPPPRSQPCRPLVEVFSASRFEEITISASMGVRSETLAAQSAPRASNGGREG